MAATRKALSLVLLFSGLIAIAWFAPSLRSLDQRFTDLLAQTRNYPASGRIVIVEIDEAAVIAGGGLPLARDQLADALVELHKAGAGRVFLDMALPLYTGGAGDKRLADMIELFGPGRLALVSYASGANDFLKPAAPFGLNANLVGGDLFADRDGWHREVRTTRNLAAGSGQLPNPSRWLTGEISAEPVRFDQRIDPQTIPRLLLSRVIAGEAGDLSGKSVILGGTAKVGTGSVNYPVLGPVDRMTVLAMGAETVLSGTELSPGTPVLWGSVVIGIALVAAVAVRITARARLLALLTMMTSGGLVAANVYVFDGARIQLHALFLFAATSAAFLVAIIAKLRLLDVISEFYSGDLTPDEAWIWRTMKDHSEPVVLLGVSGIKRANAAAARLGLFDRPADIRRLMGAITPGTEDRIAELGSIGGKRLFRCTQPFASLAVVQLDDVTEEVRTQRRIRHELETDPLTGSKNRKAFEAAARRLDAEDKAYAVVMMDMNGFKAVNDTHGHQAGDDLLRAAAQRFQGVLRPGDLLARFGGDEFAVLLPDADSAAGVAAVCTKLEASLSGAVDLGGLVVTVGVAAGHALSAGHGDFTEVMASADQAMYARKKAIKAALARAAA